MNESSFPGCSTITRRCWRWDGIRKPGLSSLVGTITANIQCFICWPSDHQRIPSRHSRGTHGSATGITTMAIPIWARRRYSLISTRKRGSIFAIVENSKANISTTSKTRSRPRWPIACSASNLRKSFPAMGQTCGASAPQTVLKVTSHGVGHRDKAIDGTVVPYAAAGSLMFIPQLALPALRTMRERYGERIYGKYGFVDALKPNTGWVNRDVIGIDLGITMLSAENARTGNVWRWFMRNPEIPRAMELISLRQSRKRLNHPTIRRETWPHLVNSFGAHNGATTSFAINRESEMRRATTSDAASGSIWTSHL